MSDISKCSGQQGFESCALRDKCKRFTAFYDPLRQSWIPAEFVKDPNDPKQSHICKNYVPERK